MVSINWGDGHTSVGTLNEIGTSNTYTITGTNTYALPGNYGISTTVTDQAGFTATIQSNAVVTEAQCYQSAHPRPSSSLLGAAVTTQIAAYIDSNPLATSANTTALINWGDGHTSKGDH